ncbi:unnamed protein product [Peniophora sp. CBMAI 1063]|nr:unnamed protein product [Peniophora sp. CBMAI 1063]
MTDAVVASMPFFPFLDTFHPAKSDRPPLPRIIFNVTLPREDQPSRSNSYYQEKYTVTDVCRAINASGVCPSIEFVNTEDVYIDIDGTPLASNDPQYKLKVDASGMDKPADGSSLPVRPMWERMRVTVEFKPESEDAVVDPDAKWTTAERKQKSVVHQTPRAIHARGQASTYVLHQFTYQPRTNVTSLMILGKWARLLRYDHAGVVASERFDWRANDGALLAEFLSRLEHATPQEEGFDDSVGDLSDFDDKPEVVEEARKAMQEFSDGMLDVPIQDDAPLRTVTCWDDSQLDGAGVPTSRTLIATYPLGLNYSIVGRYTVSFVGYDVQQQCAYWVKDSWPINDPQFTKEGRIYEHLNAAGVPHLAAVECAGEVRWKSDNSVRRTRTHEFIGAKWLGLTANIHPLSHYRILFRDIGGPVSKFESTRQLVTALSHAIEAHSAAYHKANVLHRDISPGNILINRKGDGMLIDWDLALLYSNLEKDLTGRKPRTLWRTGTWAFLSVALLSQPNTKAHELSDDLESFFWVLLYVVLRYRYGPAAWADPSHDKDFQSYMLKLFEWRNWESDGTCYGGEPKSHFLAEQMGHLKRSDIRHLRDALNHKIPRPLRDLILQLRTDWDGFYKLMRAHEDADSDSDDAESGAEDNAPEDDALPPPPLPPEAPRSPSPPHPQKRSFSTLFDDSAHLETRFRDALAASGWPKHADPSLDRFPYIHLPARTRQSLQEGAPAPIRHTRSDVPQIRRARDPANNLHIEPTRREAADDARARVGGQFYTIEQPPSRGKKRTRASEESALESIPEEREPKMARFEARTVMMRRQDAGPPTEVLLRDEEDKLVKDEEGRLVVREAWSAPSARI